MFLAPALRLAGRHLSCWLTPPFLGAQRRIDKRVRVALLVGRPRGAQPKASIRGWNGHRVSRLQATDGNRSWRCVPGSGTVASSSRGAFDSGGTAWHRVARDRVYDDGPLPPGAMESVTQPWARAIVSIRDPLDPRILPASYSFSCSRHNLLSGRAFLGVGCRAAHLENASATPSSVGPARAAV